MFRKSLMWLELPGVFPFPPVSPEGDAWKSKQIKPLRMGFWFSCFSWSEHCWQFQVITNAVMCLTVSPSNALMMQRKRILIYPSTWNPVKIRKQWIHATGRRADWESTKKAPFVFLSPSVLIWLFWVSNDLWLKLTEGSRKKDLCLLGNYKTPSTLLLSQISRILFIVAPCSCKILVNALHSLTILPFLNCPHPQHNSSACCCPNCFILKSHRLAQGRKSFRYHWIFSIIVSIRGSKINLKMTTSKCMHVSHFGCKINIEP